MEPVGIFMGICIDLSKKKTKVNMQKIYIFHIDYKHIEYKKLIFFADSRYKCFQC
jgi:hypothetical protein